MHMQPARPKQHALAISTAAPGGSGGNGHHHTMPGPGGAPIPPKCNPSLNYPENFPRLLRIDFAALPGTLQA